MDTTEIRKLRLIDKLLKVKNANLLDKIENLLSKKTSEATSKNAPNSILDFEGFLPAEDVELMKKTINETCEKTDGDVWKS